MTRANRSVDYAIAIVFAGIAAAISPPGIAFLTGRTGLSFRVTVVSLVFVALLLALAAAVLTRGRLRRAFFYVTALIFPFALLAMFEGAAVAVGLADLVAPLEDTSLLANKAPWPKYLLSNASYYTTPEGLILYRPWQGGGVAFNKLGLRSAMPTPKASGEWRIAVTGGSAAWGWHVVDADTIAARLQEALHRTGHKNVTVYNFGIGGATLKQELALLKKFRDVYGIDQALFFTGGNDVYFTYLATANGKRRAWIASLGDFELIKTMLRLTAMWSATSPQALQRIDADLLPAALKMNTLHPAIVAASDYCRSTNLRCDFALQPTIAERRNRPPAEATMAKVLERVYPRLDVLAERMYADALASGPQGHVFDLTHIFDTMSKPVFLDFVHLTEDGYRLTAEQILPIVTKQSP